MIPTIAGPVDLAADPLLLAAYDSFVTTLKTSEEAYTRKLEQRETALKNKTQEYSVLDARRKELGQIFGNGTSTETTMTEMLDVESKLKKLQTDIATLKQDILSIPYHRRVAREVASREAAYIALAEGILKEKKTPEGATGAASGAAAVNAVDTSLPAAVTGEAGSDDTGKKGGEEPETEDGKDEDGKATVTVGASLGAAVPLYGTASPTPPSDDPGTGGEDEASLLGKRGREEEEGMEEHAEPKKSRIEMPHHDLYNILRGVPGGLVAYQEATTAISNARGEGWSHKSLSDTIVDFYPEMEKHVYP